MSGRLTEPSFWDETHIRLRSRDTYPKPRRHLMDCELDRILRKYLGPLRGQSVLEVGCGSSRWLPYFAKELGLSVYGLDYSSAGITGARENLAQHGITGELIENDVFVQSQLGYPRVDALFSLGLLEHFENPVAVVEAMSRFLKPGGVVVSLVPNVRGRIVGLSCSLNPGLKDTYTSLDLADWTEVHSRCGLTIAEAVYAQFFDWTWLRLGGLPRAAQVWISRLFRVAALPVLWMGRYLGLWPRSPVWSSGIIIVARKPSAESLR